MLKFLSLRRVVMSEFQPCAPAAPSMSITVTVRVFAVTALVAFCFALGLTAQAQSPAPEIHLLPAPREAHFVGAVDLPSKVVVTAPGREAEDEFAAKDLEEAIGALPRASDPGSNTKSARGLPYKVTLLRTGSPGAKLVLSRAKLTFDPAMESEGYILSIEPHQAYVIGATGSGVFYGVQTLKQLLPLPGAPRQIPTGTVRDWPAMQYRGIDDDLSRGPFPTLKFQEHQIKVFASFKINIYSPYFEHTLLYPDRPLPAPPGS